MLIDGNAFSEGIEDFYLEHAIREMTGENSSRNPGTAELTNYVDAAALLCTTMDGPIAYWPGTAINGKMLVVHYAVPRTDAILVELEDRGNEPPLVHVHKLAEFYQTGIVDWTLRHDIGNAEDGAPLFSLELEVSGGPDSDEIRRMAEALGTAEAPRHCATLKLALEAMGRASSGS